MVDSERIIKKKNILTSKKIRYSVCGKYLVISWRDGKKKKMFIFINWSTNLIMNMSYVYKYYRIFISYSINKKWISIYL